MKVDERQVQTENHKRSVVAFLRISIDSPDKFLIKGVPTVLLRHSETAVSILNNRVTYGVAILLLDQSAVGGPLLRAL